ncbi:MAG: chemotaxis response regulator protein-glutamate methylesterase [Oscillospiraceae bacterium]
MADKKNIRVLVVDDSKLFAQSILRGLSAEPGIEVVGAACDPFEARDMILATHPDVITCDVEMPKMNGIEFVRRLLPQYFVPVVMVSAIGGAVFDAMAAGAVDFAAKPDGIAPADGFIKDLAQKIRAAAMAKSPTRAPAQTAAIKPEAVTRGTGTPGGIKVIAIGASTGGTEAIFSVLSALPPTLPPIVVVQHIPAGFSNMFAQRLDDQTALRVKEARSGDFLERGKVLIAPGDKHLKVVKNGAFFQAECIPGERVNGHCPSADVLFESVARTAGSAALGVILTGMGYDGAKGLLAMKRAGARTIGQDEATSVVYGMPKVAFDVGAVEFQVPIHGAAAAIIRLASGS